MSALVLRSRCGLLACLALAIAFAKVAGSEPTAAVGDSSGQPRAAHLVVLRLSDGVLTALVARKIDWQAPVQDVILDTQVAGMAHLVGEPSVKLSENPNWAAFDVEFSGTAVSRTVGRNGPAIIYSRSVTRFTATKRVVFVPGEGFSGLPAQVDARTQCFLEGTDSTRGGLIGQIVRRRAEREVAEREALTTAIAQQRAQRRIAEALDLHLEERIARLNWAVAVQSTLAALRPGGPTLAYSYCTTPDYLQIAIAEGREQGGMEVPERQVSGGARPAIEVWFHPSLLGSSIPDVFRGFADVLAQGGFLTAFLPQHLFAGDQPAVTRKLIGNEAFAMQTVGNWIVLELNRDPPPAVASQPMAVMTELR